MPKESKVSANIEEYLEWIYRLSKEQEKVTASDLARSLKVSPASVTNMLKRLSERGLIHHQPYQGITLTEEGRLVGARIIRRHGLLERLLCDVLRVPWHKVDDAVRHLEHYISDEVEEHLAEHLGHPTTCPHGQPLDWEHAGAAIRVSELKMGEAAIVSRIGNEAPDFLEYVASIGLMPDATIAILGRTPFGGPQRVRVGMVDIPLGDEVTRQVWVHRDSVHVAAVLLERAEPVPA